MSSKLKIWSAVYCRRRLLLSAAAAVGAATAEAAVPLKPL